MNKSTTRGFRLNAEELEPRLPPANDLFAVPTADAGSDTVQLRFEWGAGGAAFKNEIGIYAIDDAEGRVDGFLPSDPGYATVALARAQVVFARGAGIGAKNELAVRGDQLLGLYLVSNNTTQAAQAGQAVAFFTFDAANADRIDHVQTRNRGDGGRDFRFEDVLGGGDFDYNDAVISVARTHAVATPGEVGQVLLATFAKIASEAAFKNEVGLFRVDAPDGRVGNLKPGDVGYLPAALSSDTRQVIFSDTSLPGLNTRTLVLEAGALYGFYIVTNGTTESWLASNPGNTVGGPLVYSSFADANPDGLEHLDWRNANEFGLEDQAGGGDQDFNDMVIRYDFGVPLGTPSAPSAPPVPPDTTAPTGTFALVADTGVSATDRLTNDQRITATITDNASAITRLRAGFDTAVTLGYLDVLSNLANDGTLNITTALATAINGGTPLTDGQHTLFVEVADAAGNSDLLQFTFRLDRVAPGEPIYDLAPLSDSGTTGDLRTDQNVVTLTGTAEAGVTLQLRAATVPGTPGTGTLLATTTANSNGVFQFNNVPLVVGPNSFVVRTIDAAGNVGGTLAQTFTLNTAPVGNLVADLAGVAGGPDVTFDLTGAFSDAEQIVRFATTFPTGQTGNIDINVFADQTPLTVANFLAYVNSADPAQNYDGSIFHRLDVGFVLQGGGFEFDDAGTNTATTFSAITKLPAVVNEPGVSNTRGTIALAKSPGDPNSATNEFFFNLEDNSANLDGQNGGFTVFGQVMNGGQQTIDAISTLTEFNGPGLPGAAPFPIRNGADTSNFPVNITANDIATITTARVLTEAERMTFTVLANTNDTVATASITNNILTFTPLAAGTTTVTVRATDLDGSVTTNQITIVVT